MRVALQPPPKKGQAFSLMLDLYALTLPVKGSQMNPLEAGRLADYLSYLLDDLVFNVAGPQHFRNIDCKE